jgi:DNA-binding MarR family transcriptional regulator
MKQNEEGLYRLLKIGLEIHHLNKAYERRLGLSVVQWCVMKRLIDLPAVSAQALAEAVGVHPSTLTQTLRRLSRKQYIFIEEHSKDTRRKAIFITREGKAALDHMDQKLEKKLTELGGLSSDLDRVASALNHLDL